MSSRDRKRDRVLKRRRETKKRERQEDNDDTLEHYFLETTKRKREDDLEASASLPSIENRSTKFEKNTVADAAQSLSPIIASTAADKTETEASKCAPLSREERQRIKNRQRKALRKEKKAAKEELKKGILDEKQKMRIDSNELVEQQKEQEKKEKQIASKEDFQTLPLGVQYKDILVGNGPVVQDRKKVRVGYKLRAEHHKGKVIDSSGDFRFRLGKGEVVKGWDIGLVGMRQGGVRHLIVPPQAGYGGRRGGGGGGLLYFEIRLIAC